MASKNANKPNNNNQIDVLKALSGARVLVIGDIMLDRFVYGGVERISPESPVPVLSIRREDYMLGGAGNALANLAGLGVKAGIVSVSGADDNAGLIKAQIEKLGCDARSVLGDSGRPTTVKTRFLAGHQQLLRTDFEDKRPVSADILKRAMRAAQEEIGQANCVLISDYGKGFLQPAFIKDVIKAAKKAGVPVVVDPKSRDFSIYKGASVITPNKKELSEASGGMAVDTDEAVVAAARKIMKASGIEAVTATRSSEGISVITPKEEPVHIRSRNIEVFDVSGAGDTVIATIAACLAAGADLETAANMANVAGSIVVTKVGTAPIRIEELNAAVHSAGADQDRQEAVNWQEAAETAKRWKARGLKVGFTNGCFDILHLGHVSYLREARKKCDRLIVGLNRDSAVRILKGPGRPVHDENARAGVLAALSSVDMVVLFGAEKESEDNTANELIALLKPDFYFKGGDYTEEQVPEAPGVRNYGGEVCILPVWEGHSTTTALEKMKKAG